MGSSGKSKHEYMSKIRRDDPFDAGVTDFVGHQMDLFTPYPLNVYSSLYGGEDSKIQTDHIFCSNELRVYDFLTLPSVGEAYENKLFVNAENPSDHLPVGINCLV